MGICALAGYLLNRRHPLVTKEFLMTYEFGDKSKPTLVLVHGFAGTSLNFFRIFKLLEDHYHVYAFDLLGKGWSSRPEFLPSNCDETEEFFIQSIEEWRKAVGITNFYLVGHSMGGYISAKYALAHPEHIRKLVLWSPLGVERRPKNINRWMVSKNNKCCCCKSLIVKIVECFAKCHGNYNNIFKCFGRCIARKINNFILKKSFGPLDKLETKFARDYYYQVLLNKDSGESAITYCMDLYIGKLTTLVTNRLYNFLITYEPFVFIKY